jgi:hypothetical protein
VNDKTIDADYLGVIRKRKERKSIAEADRAMFEKIRYAERFQNKAV